MLLFRGSLLRFSLLILLALLVTCTSCRRYKSERKERLRHETELKWKYYGKFFCWVQDDILDEIKSEIDGIQWELNSSDYDMTYISNSLSGAQDYYESAYYQTDEMEAINNEVEDAINRLESLESTLSNIQRAIQQIDEHLESITGEGMWGEDIVRLMPQMTP